SRTGTQVNVTSFIHPLARDVPLQFAAPLSTWSYSPLPDGFEAVVGSGNAAVAASKDEGAGRWVILGFDYRVPDPASGRILANAARYRPAGPGLRVLSPPDGAAFAAGEVIPVRWAAGGGRSGQVRISFNRDGSAEDFPFEVAVADGGGFDWTAPEPADGQRFFAARIQVRWSDPPDLAAHSREAFHVVRERLSIVTDSL